MADFNSSLPVRTETNGDVVIKVVDGTVTSQTLTVNADGSVNITDNGGSLTVDGTVTVTATDLDIRDLSASQDNVAISDGTDTLAVNADGSINSVVTATNLDIRDLVFATDKVDVTGSTVALDAGTLAALESITVQNGAGAAAVNIQDGGNSITVDATDLDIRDLAAATDSVSAWLKDATGNAFSAVNPLPVTLTQDNAGAEINSYNTSADVAAGASVNHDYTVTSAKTLLLTQVEASGSGKIKVEVKTETGVGTNTFTTKFVQFNSSSDPNTTLVLKAPLTVLAGVRVRITLSNRDLLPMDVYSTLCGNEVP